MGTKRDDEVVIWASTVSESDADWNSLGTVVSPRDWENHNLGRDLTDKRYLQEQHAKECLTHLVNEMLPGLDGKFNVHVKPGQQPNVTYGIIDVFETANMAWHEDELKEKPYTLGDLVHMRGQQAVEDLVEHLFKIIEPQLTAEMVLSSPRLKKALLGSKDESQSHRQRLGSLDADARTGVWRD